MNDNEDIKTVAIDRLAAQLTNLGCVFRIDREGVTLHDTLPVQAPEKKKKAPRRDFESMGIYESVKKMQPGEVVRVTAPEGLSLIDIQGSLSARMVGLFGKGNYMTQQRKEHNAIDVLRLA